MDGKTLPMISHALREYIHPSALEPLNGFVLVKTSATRSYYLCFGRHDFFLVPRLTIASAVGHSPSTSPQPTNTAPVTATAARRASVTSLPQKHEIQVISYRAVDKILKCTDTPESCTIVFTPGTLARYKNESSPLPNKLLHQLQLQCSEREKLMTELLVGIKASHMFLTFEVHTKEMVEEYSLPKEPTLVALSSSSSSSAAAAKNRRGATPSVPLAAQQAVRSFMGYLFTRPPDYEEVPRPGLLKKQFDRPVRGGAGGEVQFEIGKASSNPYVKLDAASLHFEILHGSAGESLQSLAERSARAICSQVDDWRLAQRPYAPPKRCLNDPSLWSCWMMRFRTLKSTSRALEYRLVTLIACRRSFIPPSMTSQSDFCITHISQYNDLELPAQSDVALRVLESLQPEAKTFDRDEVVVQHTLDALLLDSAAWKYLDQTIKLRPSIHDTIMRKFCRTLVEFLLEAENAHSVWTPAQKIQNVSLMNAWDAQAQQQQQQQQSQLGASVQSKLFNYVTNRHLSYQTTSAGGGGGSGGGGGGGDEDKQGGTTNQTEDEVMIATLMGLAEVAENHPPALNVDAEEEDEDTRRDWAAWKTRVWSYLAYCVDGAVYHQVLDFDLLTKVWKANNTKPGLKQTVGAVLDRCIHLQNGRTESLATLVSQTINAPEITFNASALGKLLKTGYVQAALSEHDATLFSKFLVRLLLSDNSRQAVASDETLEPIAHAVLKCLVTFSLDEDHEANLNLLVPALIRVFMSHPDDDKLRTWCVSILVNFSRNNNAVKSNILAGGGFAREIISLLRSKDDDLVRHACSLLLNLAKTSSEFRQSLYRGNLKQFLVDLMRKVNLANLRLGDLFRSPKIIALACQTIGHLAVEEDIRLQLLEGEETQNDSDGLFRISALVRTLVDLVCKEAHLGDEVRFSSLFALKNLSIGTGVRSSLGRYASRDLIKILRDKDVRDALVVDYLLRVVYSLCWDVKISSKLVSEKLLDGLALRKQAFPNLCLQIKSKIDANQDPKHAPASAPASPRAAGGDGDGAAAASGLITGGILRSSRAGRSSSVNGA